MKSFIAVGATCAVLLTNIAAAKPPAQPELDVATLRKPDAAAAIVDEKRGLAWYNALDLTMEGRGWADRNAPYRRLPMRAKDFATSAVWNLSGNTAGICVRFVTDSTTISAAWDGNPDGAMNHMAASGSAGLDLYAKRANGYEYVGTGRPSSTWTTATLTSSQGPKPTEYILYLPLYHRLSDLKIGVCTTATITSAPPRPEGADKPIIFYGTSITQGGCASRSGMCHPALLGRWLNREVINLGFSGSGKMEPPLAELFSELDPCLFILECLPNMTTEMVTTRVEPFVKVLREKHPDMPILLVENPLKAHTSEQNVELQKAFDRLKKDGIKNLHYLNAEPQLAGDENGTVDGVHPTDLGFYRMAKAYQPVLQKILASQKAVRPAKPVEAEKSSDFN
ncbi:MAG: SGNH/GDSL hydrolase family protein [Candidatus Sumerlaeaceae bacterium]|nr:SGNH/GDSL hydrolase family protein [Candidatus Sumerlaeaceae bacterium]